MDLYNCIIECKNGNDDAKLELIKTLKPSIDSYNRRFLGEDIESLLIIAILKTISNIKIENFDINNQGALLNYFILAIRNGYIDYVRKESNKTSHIEYCSDDILSTFEDSDKFSEIESALAFNDAIKSLTELQQRVLIGIFIDGYSNVHIAKLENISKQAVNGIKKRALKKLSESNVLIESRCC